MASFTSALDSVYGTVSSAASSVGALFDTGAAGISMLNRYVATAAEQQKLRHEYDNATYEHQLHKRVAIAEAKQNHEIRAFYDADAANKALFETAFKRIEAAVAAKRNPPKASA